MLFIPLLFPHLEIKSGYITGGVNEASFLIDRKGVFYVQISKICGVYPGFIPAPIECVSS